MSVKTGIRFVCVQDADLAKTNDTLANTDLTFSIAAGEKVKGRAILPVTLAGTASGAKFLVDAPAAPAVYQVEYKIINGNSGAVATTDIILAEAAFSNALANATTHFAEVDFYIENGTTEGDVTIQFAQLVTDASAATLLEGATLEVVRL